VIVTKKAIDRRTVLRGIGVSLALPFLDSMIPALSATVKPTNRLGVVYVPNGVMMDSWTPKVEGAGFEFTPILKPLEPFRQQLLVLSGLNSTPPKEIWSGAGVHARASTRFLTDIAPKPSIGADLQAGTSMDQIAAQALGKYTQLASLEIGLESSETAGSTDQGFSRAYTSTIAWRTPTTPLPMENNPRVVFERLFGDTGSTDPALRLARIREQRSILDSVTAKAARLQRELGAADRAKITEYFEAIRDTERRIEMAEKQNEREFPLVEHPAGIPAKFEEHARLMYDLFALAYQCDLTRVVSMMMGREFSGRTYPEIGVPDSHHPISHHMGDPEKIVKLAKINQYHVTFFAYFLEKLRSTPDGDGSLLDHSTIIYGAGMSDSNAHDPTNLPILVAGGGAGQIKGGRHLRFPAGTPLANLHLTTLDMLGVHVDKMGDSSGEFQQLGVS
jgi:hypothetical protein